MPHFGLMDETRMDERAASLMRARLHIRGGKRRLREEKNAAGVSALYDALLAAMRFYVLAHADGETLSRMHDGLEDEDVLFHFFEERGILSRKDVTYLLSVIGQALENSLSGVDGERLVAEVDAAMARLEVMPFDEALLPPEDPSTF